MKTVIGKAMIDGRRLFVRDYMSTESVPAGMACYKEGNMMNVRFLEAVVSGKVSRTVLSAVMLIPLWSRFI